jgi:hypothetical protein
MFERWKERFIAGQDEKTQAARSKLAETKRREREAELKLEQATRDYQETVAGGAKGIAEVRAKNDAVIRAKEEAIKTSQAEDEAEIERLRKEIAGLDEQLEVYKK